MKRPRFMHFRIAPLLVGAVSALMIIAGAHGKPKPVAYDREAKLYRLPSGDPFIAKFHHARKGTGDVQIDLSARQVLTGEYAPVKSGDTRWGQLFQSSAANSTNVNLKGLQRGIMAAEGAGMSIICAYVTTASGQGGYGFCKDSAEVQYRLMF
jgi:hypothetical protein